MSTNVRRAHDPLPTFRRWWRRVAPDRRWIDLQRRKLKSGLCRFRPWLNNCWFSTFLRRQPGIALWVFVLCVVAVGFRVWNGPPEGPEYIPTEQDRWVGLRAKDAVNRSLRVIGRGLDVNQVVARPMERGTLGSYHWAERIITYNSDAVLSLSEFELIAAHECVHAMFDRSRGDVSYRTVHWERCVLVEETTAYVLGAYIAGAARTRQGGDGRALTEKLVGLHRDACDWSSPDCVRRKVWEKAIAEGAGAIDPDQALSVAVHFGSVEMVDDIDQICREYPDPWEAVAVVIERYIDPIEGRPAVLAAGGSASTRGE